MAHVRIAIMGPTISKNFYSVIAAFALVGLAAGCSSESGAGSYTDSTTSESSAPPVSSNLDSTSSTVTTIATTRDSEPTWITIKPEDLFVAPFAQAVCDVLRTWRPPAGTTSDEVSLLKKATSGLEEMLFNGESKTYLDIFVNASAALEYEKKYPNDDLFPFTYARSEGICDGLGLTTQNSRFGIDPLTGNSKGE